MKAVSEKTWVQKAVFLEPKPLFSSALTIWRRGWYLCMEFRIICMGEGFERVRLTDLSSFQNPTQMLDLKPDQRPQFMLSFPDFIDNMNI